jgi:hypothetical protein
VRTQHVAINERITVVGAVRKNLDHREYSRDQKTMACAIGQSTKCSIVLRSIKTKGDVRRDANKIRIVRHASR